MKIEKEQKRLDEFRNLYGFARNMAFSLGIAAVTFAVGWAARLLLAQ